MPSPSYRKAFCQRKDAYYRCFKEHGNNDRQGASCIVNILRRKSRLSRLPQTWGFLWLDCFFFVFSSGNSKTLSAFTQLIIFASQKCALEVHDADLDHRKALPTPMLPANEPVQHISEPVSLEDNLFWCSVNFICRSSRSLRSRMNRFLSLWTHKPSRNALSVVEISTKL